MYSEAYFFCFEPNFVSFGEVYNLRTLTGCCARVGTGPLGIVFVALIQNIFQRDHSQPSNPTKNHVQRGAVLESVPLKARETLENIDRFFA
eukprot:3428372-Amphidinium_carterae.1